MRTRISYYIYQVILGKKKGPFAYMIKAICWVLSWPYRLGVFLRNWAYDNEWLRQYQPPVPVVMSIGNLVAGGSGKTPVTQLIAGTFYEEYKIAILSRGYRSSAEKKGSPVLLSSGRGPLHSAAYAGDEPYLLAANLPKVWVLVGKDRIQSANLAAREGIELILLDDGMQHRQMARDYEVVVIDASDPFGQGYFLPRGLLRESPESLKRADLIVLNHLGKGGIFEKVKNEILPFTSAPVIGVGYKGAKVYDEVGKEWPTLEGKRAALFCGIAKPERFLAMAQEMGAEIVDSRFFPDHYPFSIEEIATLAKEWQAKGAECLLCTEKDRVKLPDGVHLSIPLLWIKIQYKVVEGEQAFEQFIDHVRKDLNRRTLATT